MDFVRAFGEIQGLEELAINGHYAKHWPAYFEEKMSIRVRATRGHCLEEWKARLEDLDGEQLRSEIVRREYNERVLREFTDYQQGTEGLIP